MHKLVHFTDGPRPVHFGGWKKQSVDTRDENYRLKLPQGFMANPVSCDNRNICSPVVDQGNLGSCTANGFSALVEADEVKGGATKLGATAATVTVSGVATQSDGSTTFSVAVVPASAPTPTPAPAPAPKKLIRVSRLLEYYATRKIEGTVNQDSGASIRDTIKAAVSYGIADETLWPYDISKFAVNPPLAVWTAASTHKITSYHSIADGDGATFRSTLASGLLIEFGFTVYDYMLSADMAAKGYLPLPSASEAVQGGHAVCLVGYNDQFKTPKGTITKAYLVRNSWGTNWGIGGYFWMDAAYVENTRLSSDFWVVMTSPI
jgi:C1A family cysteine protease